MAATPEEIRDRFSERRNLYQMFATAIKALLETILIRHNIVVQNITCRVKEVDSLYKKLIRPGKHYDQLEDITDLAGIRIIAYLPEDVDRAAQVIDNEFAVDRINSVDKRHQADPDRFGYASLHQVCSLSANRADLIEYARFKELKCEIQVRTILQHAWAEIEHDLGYKAAVGLPAHLKRRFSRIAAYLEGADEEFMRLKNEIEEYTKEAEEKTSEPMPGDLLDRITLKKFIFTNKTLRQIEEAYKDPGVNLRHPNPETLDDTLSKLKYLGVNHVDSLASAVKRHKEHFLKAMTRFAEVDFGPSGVVDTNTDVGWALQVLMELICAEKLTKEETVEGLRYLDTWIPDSLTAYADSLRKIVRDEADDGKPIDTYGSVYVTVEASDGTGGSFPMTPKDGAWTWEDVSLTNEALVIGGNKFPIRSRNPLHASGVYQGKTVRVGE